MNKKRGDKLLNDAEYWKRRCKAAEKVIFPKNCYTVDDVKLLIADWKKIVKELKNQ